MVSLVWLQGGKDMSSISNPGFDVLLSASCLADNASYISEALNIFYVLFCDLDQCVGSFVDIHALCFLGVYI